MTWATFTAGDSKRSHRRWRVVTEIRRVVMAVCDDRTHSLEACAGTAAMSDQWVVLYWQQETEELGRWVEVKAPTEQAAVDIAGAFHEAGYRVEIEEPEEQSDE